MAVIDTGTSTAGKANVDSNFNLNVVTPTNKTQAGYVVLAGDVSGGTTPSALLGIDVTQNHQMAVGQTTLLWDDTLNAAAQNTGKYRAPVTTQTVTFGSGYVTLNGSAITTANTDSAYQTYRVFPLFAKSELRFNAAVVLTQTPQANDTVEIGLFNAALPGRAIPTDGVFFRYNTAGELRGVTNYNGTETQTGTLTIPSVNVSHDYTIVIQTNNVLFYVDDVLLGTLVLLSAAPTQGQPMMAASAPVTIRHYIGASTPGLAQQVKVSDIMVTMRGAAPTRDWAQTKAGFGHMAYQGQNGGTMGTTALYSNNLAIGAGAAMTNTTAALGSGLGGQFTAQPTLAAGTDGIVSSFQVPVQTVNLTGRNLILTGITLDAAVTAALTGGPVLYLYSLAFGHTAVSLATAEAATTKAPRRIALGFHNFVVTAPAGTLSGGVFPAPIIKQFLAPIVVAPGEFVQVVAKNAGTVTSAGTITFMINFDGYFE